MTQLGAAARGQGDHAAARVLYEEAAGVAREIGDGWTLGLALTGLARSARQRGSYDEAAALYREALAVTSQFEDLWITPRALDGLAGVASLEADYGRAARLFGASAALRESGGVHEMPSWRTGSERDVADVRAALGDAAFAAAWAEGRAMTLEQAVAYALEAPNPP